MQSKTSGKQKLGLAVLGFCLAIVGAVALAPQQGRSAVTPPSTAAPVKTAPLQVPGREVATFAAGCFWSMEAMFKQLKGVDKVEPGYAGGSVANPSYEQVETGGTGHAETVRIVFDPKVISYGQLLDVLLTSRNPTTLNSQGPDEGPQYRSVIFAMSRAQEATAKAKIKEFTDKKVWDAPIVTPVQPFSSFYRAEDYHLNYYNLHPNQGYCAQVIKPELDEFRAKFKSWLKN